MKYNKDACAYANIAMLSGERYLNNIADEEGQAQFYYIWIREIKLTVIRRII